MQTAEIFAEHLICTVSFKKNVSVNSIDYREIELKSKGEFRE